MVLSVMFDGHELSEYLSVLSGFERGIGSGREIELQKIGRRRGKEFISSSKDVGSFSMPFILRYDLIEKRRKLAAILDVDEPKKLIFGDEPDRYYMAMPTGDINVAENNFLGKGTISWVIPDAVAHSTTIKPFTGAINPDGVMEIEIDNKGTAAVPITYRIKHKKENGYVGIVSEHGAMQFGKIDEVDGFDYEKSLTLLDTRNFSEFKPVVGINPENPEKDTGGSLKVTMVEGQQALGVNTLGTSNKKMTGGLWEYTLPVDETGSAGADNWYCYFNVVYEAWAMGLTGDATISFVGDQDKLIAAVSLNKDDASGNTGRVYFEVGNGGTEFPRGYAFKMIPFVADRNSGNPYNMPRGHSDIIKEGENFKFYWYGAYFPITEPRVKDLKVKKIQLYLGQYSSKATVWLNLISQMLFRRVLFIKNNAELWEDVPNRYPAQSELVIDGNERKPYMNGLVCLDDEIKGTKYFLAPPGKTKVLIYHSDFSELESATAEIEEAWI